MSRCQLQYLDRRAWVDCAKPAPVAVDVEGVSRHVCRDHRDDVRRIQQAGLGASLRWSEHPTRPRRQPDQGQQALVDVPAVKRRRGWSL